MPIIPLYQDGQAPRPPRRPNQPVTGNPASGVRVSIGSIADDLQQPLMDNRGAIAQGRAGEAMGQAVGQVGGIAYKLGMERMDAQNKIDVANAEMKMDQHAAAFEQWKTENPDPRGWEDGWKKHMEKFSPLDDKMSPNAREAASARFSLFQGQSAIRIATDATKQTFANAKNLFGTRAQIAARNGDVEGVRKIFTENGKYFQPGEDEGMLDFASRSKERLDKQAEADAEKEKVNTAYQAALDDPKGFLEKPDDFTTGLDPQQKDALANQARQAIAQQHSDAVDALSDRMASGEFKTLADMRAAFPEELPPRTRKQFEDSFQRSQIPGMKAKLEADAPANFARFSDAVDAYNAQDDKEGARYVQMNIAIKSALPESGFRKRLLNSLENKRTGKGDFAVPEPLRQTARDIVTTMFEAEAFGKYKVASPVDETKIIDDPQKKAAAQAKRGSVMIYMEDWMEANPKATPDKVFEVIRQMIAGNAPVIRSTAAQAPPDYRPRPASTDPTRPNLPNALWELDLPNEPGGPQPNDLLYDLNYNP